MNVILTWKLATSRINWAGHVERMGGERLTKGTDALKWRVEGEEDDRDWDGRLREDRFGGSGREE